MSESLFAFVTIVLVVAFWLCWNRHEIFGVKGCDCSVCTKRRERAAAEAADDAAYRKEKQAAEKLAALSSSDRKLHRLINHPNCPEGLFVGDWDRLREPKPDREPTPEEVEWREYFEKQQAKADYLEEYPESVEEGYSYEDYQRTLDFPGWDDDEKEEDLG